MHCARVGCPFSHGKKKFSQYHRHCCNACANDEEVHTNNCKGAGQLVQVPSSWKTFTIPSSWMRGHFEVREVVEWYERMPFAKKADSDVMRHWEAFAKFLDNQKQCDTLQRNIQLIAVTSKEYERTMKWDEAILLEALCIAKNWRTEDTGLKYSVQNSLMMQNAIIDALWEAAAYIIETKEIARFAFVCHTATDCSVGCSLLLAVFVFPRAHIVLTTPDAQQAAIDCGLIPLYS